MLLNNQRERELWIKKKKKESNVIVTRYDDELYHYGVLGMKWGVRRYRNADGSYTNTGSKRYYKKSLNKTDQDYVNAAAKYMRADHATSVLSSKNKRLLAKSKTQSERGKTKSAHKTLQKVQKNTDKIDTYAKKAKTAQSAMDAAESKTWKLIAEASTNGYSVNSKKVVRNGEKGRTYAAAILGGIYGSIGYTSATAAKFGSTYRAEIDGKYFDQNPTAIIGNKYSVR